MLSNIHQWKGPYMKHLVICVVVVILCAGVSYAQDNQAAKPASMTASLNKALGMYVFPAKDQKPEQQAADEQAC